MCMRGSGGHQGRAPTCVCICANGFGGCGCRFDVCRARRIRQSDAGNRPDAGCHCGGVFGYDDVAGEPRVIYTLVGVLILGVLDNGLTQLRVDSYVREILVGLIVIAVVAVASLSKRSRYKPPWRG